jgi:hypothetical protein
MVRNMRFAVALLEVVITRITEAGVERSRA